MLFGSPAPNVGTGLRITGGRGIDGDTVTGFSCICGGNGGALPTTPGGNTYGGGGGDPETTGGMNIRDSEIGESRPGPTGKSKRGWVAAPWPILASCRGNVGCLMIQSMSCSVSNTCDTVARGKLLAPNLKVFADRFMTNRAMLFTRRGGGMVPYHTSKHNTND